MRLAAVVLSGEALAQYIESVFPFPGGWSLVSRQRSINTVPGLGDRLCRLIRNSEIDRASDSDGY